MSIEFKWTADLLAEFIKDYGDKNEPVAELMEQFKAIKQPKQDWEIITYRYVPLKDKNVLINKYSQHWISALKGSADYEIHSVKRLSDGEVFSLGDKVVYMNNHSIYDIITKIRLGEFQFGPKSSPAPYFVVEKNRFGCYIDKINHYIPQILFTTEDGAGISIGDIFWYTTADLNIYSERCDSLSGSKVVAHAKLGDKYFSTKDKAEEFVKTHKPILSISDVLSIFDGANSDWLENISIDLIRKVEDKLNKP